MIISVHATNDVTLDEEQDFRAFKVAVLIPDATLEEARVALAGVATLPDRDTAWVSAESLREWRGVKDNAEWQKGFDAMIEKAKPHGWIDQANNTIKAHVEWV
jgi:hypothetical protein